VARALRGKIEKDGSYTAPTELVKTYVATTRGVEEFGRDLRIEADRRGLAGAREIVCIQDNGHPKAGPGALAPDVGRTLHVRRCAAAFRPCSTVTSKTSTSTE